MLCNFHMRDYSNISSSNSSERMYTVMMLIVLGMTQCACATDTVLQLNISQYVGRWYEVSDHDPVYKGRVLCWEFDMEVLIRTGVKWRQAGCP